CVRALDVDRTALCFVDCSAFALPSFERTRHERPIPLRQIAHLRFGIQRSRTLRLRGALVVDVTAFRGGNVNDSLPSLRNAAEKIVFFKIQLKAFVESAEVIEDGCTNCADRAGDGVDGARRRIRPEGDQLTNGRACERSRGYC